VLPATLSTNSKHSSSLAPLGEWGHRKAEGTPRFAGGGEGVRFSLLPFAFCLLTFFCASAALRYPRVSPHAAGPRQSGCACASARLTKVASAQGLAGS